MSLHFVTYGDSKYFESLKRIEKEANEINVFNTCNVYTPEKLSQDFKDRFSTLLKQSRGGGYWFWKPYVVYETMYNVKEGDWILYADAGCTIIKDSRDQVCSIINTMEDKNMQISAYRMPYIEYEYTKEDLLSFLNVGDDIRNSGHYMATTFFVKNTETTRKIFKDMLSIMENHPHLIDDTKSILENNPKFKDHRHDQSLFSIIRKINKNIVYVTDDETYKGSSFIQATRIRC